MPHVTAVVHVEDIEIIQGKRESYGFSSNPENLGMGEIAHTDH